VKHLKKRLANPRVALYAAVIGVLLCMPSLWVGWVGDDYHHQSRLLKEYGILPWWVWDDIRAAMCRSKTHLCVGFSGTEAGSSRSSCRRSGSRSRFQRERCSELGPGAV